MQAVTPGAYVVAPSGWAAGAYRNSLGRASAWAGHRFETADGRFAQLVGAATGYGRRTGPGECATGRKHSHADPCWRGGAALMPMLAPSVCLGDGPTVARLSYLPKVGQGAHAIHLSLEF